MMSKPILGTGNKIKMSWVEYIFTHMIPTWGQSLRTNFRIWADLMTDNFGDYVLLEDDDPFTECYDWFWSSLNVDDVYPKEFLEYLLQLADDVKTGKVEPISWDEIKEDMKLLSVDDVETGIDTTKNT
jgi:hypothetical protein